MTKLSVNINKIATLRNSQEEVILQMLFSLLKMYKDLEQRA